VPQESKRNEGLSMSTDSMYLDAANMKTIFMSVIYPVLLNIRVVTVVNLALSIYQDRMCWVSLVVHDSVQHSVSL
jgi:multidrug transporter EmrE-like cation transporter